MKNDVPRRSSHSGPPSRRPPRSTHTYPSPADDKRDHIQVLKQELLLTLREAQILLLMIDGLTDAAIAKALPPTGQTKSTHVSRWTVSTHVAHIRAKLGRRALAVARGIQVLHEHGLWPRTR